MGKEEWTFRIQEISKIYQKFLGLPHDPPYDAFDPTLRSFSLHPYWNISRLQKYNSILMVSPYMFRWTESLTKVLKKGLQKVTGLKKVLKKVMTLKKGLKK